MQKNQKLKEAFFMFLSKYTSLEDFKHILLDNIIELEKLFSRKDYFEILDFDFKNKFSHEELSKILYNYIDKNEYLKWDLEKKLKAIINKDDKILEILLEIYNNLDSYDFLENLVRYGCSIGCYLEEPAYYSTDFIKNTIEEEFTEIKQEAEKILKDLEEGKITINE